MKYFFTIILIIAIANICFSQDGSYNNLSIGNLTKNDGAYGYFGWGNATENTSDPRPNYNLNSPGYLINHHTGLTFSAHSFYGGIRFYNQGYPNAYNPANGSIMVMSITNGNVGIGTTNPNSILNIVRTIGGSEATGLSLGNLSDAAGTAVGINFQLHSLSATMAKITAVREDAPYAPTSLRFYTYNDAISPNGLNERMRITPSGDVAIGTSDPKGYKLAVNGSAVATSITVKMNNAWPDYVFKPSYHLPQLTQVKGYIEKNGHLPEMPSETEVANEGINLGEMNRLLTKKVEELTLYLIENDKKDKQKDRLLENLQRQIDQLKRSK